jgi:hypothetical protein
MGYSTSARDQLAGLGVHHFRRDLDGNCIVGGTGVALALHEASLVTAAAMAVGVLAGPLTTPCRIGRPMAGKP